MALENPNDAKLLRPKRAAKYGNAAITLFGIRFDSIAEAGHYVTLIDRYKRGEISKPEVHPKFQFKCGHRYEADFAFWTRDGKSVGRRIVQDVKGVRTALHARNMAMMKHEYGIEVEEITPKPEHYNIVRAIQGVERAAAAPVAVVPPIGQGLRGPLTRKEPSNGA